MVADWAVGFGRLLSYESNPAHLPYRVHQNLF
jgi:hypothetical protein